MANRSAAAIFSVAFKECATEHLRGDPQVQLAVSRIAQRLWVAQQDYDFSEDQMECNDALLELGFAKKIPETHPGYESEKYTAYLKPDGEFR